MITQTTLMAMPAGTDYSLVDKKVANEGELPTWIIPGKPESAEAYYDPDSYTDDSKSKWRANDRGQVACSYIMPDGKRIVYTSTRDNLDMPVGNGSNDSDFLQGAELYIADMDGSNVKRLTNNKVYDAEVSVSPDGSKIIFTRQIDEKLDLWMMNSDGTGEHQISFTDDWQEAHRFFLPDNKTITMRAWKRSESGERMTKMTVFTVNTETKEITPITTDAWMNWAPYPTLDGKHYVFVRPLVENPRNWEVFLGSINGSAAIRLTYNDSFPGFPSVSPDGTKMLFTRSVGKGFMSDLYTYVMDISSLNVGPTSH